MKILIIGGTKFIGKAITAAMSEKPFEIILFNRGLTSTSSKYELIQGDLEKIIDHKKSLLERNFDIVIHCIAYTEKHALDIKEIFKNTKTKLIVLSSCDSYDAFQGLNRQIDLAELPINENSPLSSIKYYWRNSAMKGNLAKMYDKNLMADILMDSFSKNELNLTIFKLPMVYGPGDYQYPGRHGEIIQRIIDKQENIILSDREQCQIYTYGYIENVAAAVIHCFDKKITNGKIYNIGEDKSRTRRRWADLFANSQNWKFKFHIIPEELIRDDKSFRNSPPQHLLTDSSLYERDTGFKKPIDLKEAIKRTFEYAKENPDILGEVPNYEDEKKLIEVYYSHIDLVHEKLTRR